MMTVNVTVENGSVSFWTLQGLRIIEGDTPSSFISFEGSLTRINYVLSKMIFQSKENFFGNASLSVAANDNGNTGTGGSQISYKLTNILVEGQQDDPKLWYGDTVVQEGMVYEIDAVEDEKTALSKVSIVDPDMNASRIVLLSVSLFRGNGNLSKIRSVPEFFPRIQA